jgi:CHAD domain-containing protein
MAEGKWIDELTPDTPAADAARRVLDIRLQVVQANLQRALSQPDDDQEYVHQLRVGTRRAGAASKIFRPWLPRKIHKKTRRWLRELRGAAGAARDWDVFLGTLLQRKPQTARQQGGFDWLLGYALGQRMAAQAELEAVGEDAVGQAEMRRTKTVEAVRELHGESETQTLLDLARPTLRELLDNLHQAVAHDLSDYRQLHQVRIVGKRLRYAMEIFVSCFSSAFRDEVYPAVEEMQEILGRANDSHVASEHLTAARTKLRVLRPDAWRRYQLGFDGLLRYHQRRVLQERRRFLKWWQEWQQSGTETALGALLRQPAEAVVSGVW